jgi:hypothetical protein
MYVQWPEEKNCQYKKKLLTEKERHLRKKPGVVVENKHEKVIQTRYQTLHGLFD